MSTFMLFDRFFNDHDLANSNIGIGNLNSNSNYLPRVDLKEKDDYFFMQIDLPGMTSENVRIEVKDRILTIEGERKFENDDKDCSYYIKERFNGKFSRSFNFGCNLNDSLIKAEMKNGVLILEVPKPENKRPKLIKVL